MCCDRGSDEEADALAAFSDEDALVGVSPARRESTRARALVLAPGPVEARPLAAALVPGLHGGLAAGPSVLAGRLAALVPPLA